MARNHYDETSDILCSPCQTENKRTDGDLFCLDCQDYYCTKCFEFHKKMPALSSHKLIGKSEFHSKLTKGSVPIVPSEQCTRHVTKVIDIYCTDHKIVGCDTCMTLEHTSCKKLNVSEHIESLMKFMDINGCNKDCADIGLKANGQIKAIEENLRTLKNKKGNALNDLKSFKKELIVRLDEIEKRAIKQLDTVCEDIESKWTDTITVLQRDIKDMDQYISKLNSAAQNQSQQFVCASLCKMIASSAKQQTQKIHPNVNDITCIFTPCLELQTLITSHKILGTSVVAFNHSQNVMSLQSINNQPTSGRELADLIHVEAGNVPHKDWDSPFVSLSSQNITVGPHRFQTPTNHVWNGNPYICNVTQQTQFLNPQQFIMNQQMLEPSRHSVFPYTSNIMSNQTSWNTSVQAQPRVPLRGYGNTPMCYTNQRQQRPYVGQSNTLPRSEKRTKIPLQIVDLNTDIKMEKPKKKGEFERRKEIGTEFDANTDDVQHPVATSSPENSVAAQFEAQVKAAILINDRPASMPVMNPHPLTFTGNEFVPKRPIIQESQFISDNSDSGITHPKQESLLTGEPAFTDIGPKEIIVELTLADTRTVDMIELPKARNVTEPVTECQTQTSNVSNVLVPLPQVAEKANDLFEIEGERCELQNLDNGEERPHDQNLVSISPVEKETLKALKAEIQGNEPTPDLEVSDIKMEKPKKKGEFERRKEIGTEFDANTDDVQKEDIEATDSSRLKQEIVKLPTKMVKPEQPPPQIPVEPAPVLSQTPTIQEEISLPTRQDTPEPQSTPDDGIPKEQVMTEEFAEKSLEDGKIVDDDKEEEMDKLAYKYADDQWSPQNSDGKKHYDREFLLQFQFDRLAICKPARLPDIPDIVLYKPNYEINQQQAYRIPGSTQIQQQQMDLYQQQGQSMRATTAAYYPQSSQNMAVGTRGLQAPTNPIWNSLQYVYNMTQQTPISNTQQYIMNQQMLEPSRHSVPPYTSNIMSNQTSWNTSVQAQPRVLQHGYGNTPMCYTNQRQQRPLFYQSNTLPRLQKHPKILLQIVDPNTGKNILNDILHTGTNVDPITGIVVKAPCTKNDSPSQDFWSGVMPVTAERLEFTRCDSVPKSPPTGLPMPEIWNQLHTLIVDKNANNEIVFDWIESNVDEPTRNQSHFKRALMTAVCSSGIIGNKGNEKVDEEKIRSRYDLLLKYLDHKAESELQALYAVQALITKLEHPPGLLKGLFDILYDEDIISEDSFLQWERSDEEPDGKGAATKQTLQFFTWLRESEDS